MLFDYDIYEDAPPLEGAPWSWVDDEIGQRAPGTLTRGASTAYLERVPSIKTQSEQDRLRRATDKLSVLVNALFGAGQLRQTGAGEFEIVIDDGEV